MASDLAWDVISQVNETQNGSRQIFFAKYVYWVVSFPVVTIALGIVSGVSCKSTHTNPIYDWTKVKVVVVMRDDGVMIEAPLPALRGRGSRF